MWSMQEMLWKEGPEGGRHVALVVSKWIDSGAQLGGCHWCIAQNKCIQVTGSRIKICIKTLIKTV